MEAIKINSSFLLFILQLLFYILIFILPVILYIKYIDKVAPLEFLKLKQNPWKGLLKGIFISTLFISLLIIKKIVLGWGNLNFNIGLLWLSALTVGFLEEIPFRGFILQKLNKHMNFICANILTTLLFVSFHIPIWLYTGSNILDSFKSIFIASFALGYLFKETDSLWVSIICHSVFNLSIWIGLS